MFDAVTVLREHQIPFWTEGKNVSPGWINVQCPFCNDHSNHCGINPVKYYVNCWKCGRHSIKELLVALLNISYRQADQIIEENETYDPIALYKQKRQNTNTSLSLPPGTGDLKKMHKSYLLSRNFNPEEIVSRWSIRGTEVLGPYAYRIIIPIFLNSKLVSYQGRDVTGKSELRYMACQPEDEIVSHKSITYGCDKIRNRKAIIVEGVFDVWRMGPGAVATFGTSYSNAQIKFIQQIIDTAFLLFDPGDEQAEEKAHKLALQLSAIGTTCELIELEDHDGRDPADLTQDEADYLKKYLIG